MLAYIISCLLCLASCKATLISPSNSRIPEIDMNTIEVIKYYGYPGESHQAITEDGYILSLQRIPYGLKSPSTVNRPVVFLQHGLEDSSFTWVANEPGKSLAFILADSGFDVWLGNTRGNTYSNSHKSYSKNSRRFWDFTWDDMAKYDLGAMINYALSVSKAQKLGYIGHSQGTTIGFAQFSQDANLNSKVSAFVALAPAAYLGHLKSAIKYIATLGAPFHLMMTTLGTGEFLPSNQLMKAMSKFVCGDQMGSLACGNLLFLLQGYNTDNLNYTRIPIYTSHSPAGTSSKNIHHYCQSYLSNKFQKYDYGYLGNKLKYGQLTPPQYSLDIKELPIAMFWGGNDWLAVPEDVNRAIVELGDNVKLKRFIPEYNHVDFIWGSNAYNRIYPDIVNFLRQYQ